MTDLPITLVPNTDPPRFRWRQVVSHLGGTATVDHEGTMPPTIEVALALTIGIARQALHECAMLRGECDGLRDRLAEADDPPEAPTVAAPLSVSVKGAKGK